MNKIIELGFHYLEFRSNSSGQWFRFFRRGSLPTSPINIMAAEIKSVSNELIEFNIGFFTYSFRFKDKNKYQINMEFMAKLFHCIPYWRITGYINNGDKVDIITAFKS